MFTQETENAVLQATARVRFSLRKAAVKYLGCTKFFQEKKENEHESNIKRRLFKEYAQPMAVIDIAKDISEGLARMACVAEIDGEVKDLRTIVDKDCTLNIFTAKDPEGLAALRHTASHVMAQAIKRIWPETKFAIGPSIARRFLLRYRP